MIDTLYTINQFMQEPWSYVALSLRYGHTDQQSLQSHSLSLAEYIAAIRNR